MAYAIEKGKKFIPADSGCFQYMGRIDFDDPARPVLVWVASTVDVIFTGTSVAAVLKNIDLQEHAYFGAFVDGVQQSFEMKHGREDELYVLAENLEPGEHTLRLMKRLA
ncbi:MAG: electron transporter RnfD, partial [Oscillospiraceae bacterium]